MKKSKLFFLAASLVLLTAGVFAFAPKMLTDTNPPNLYYLDGSSYQQIVGSTLTAGAHLVYNPSGTPPGASISGTVSKDLYAFVSSAWQRVYETGF